MAKFGDLIVYTYKQASLPKEIMFVVSDTEACDSLGQKSPLLEVKNTDMADAAVYSPGDKEYQKHLATFKTELNDWKIQTLEEIEFVEDAIRFIWYPI